MDRWEYKSIQFKTRGIMGGVVDIDQLDAMLNNLGSQGWELVSCIASNAGYGHTRNVVAVLKRKASM